MWCSGLALTHRSWWCVTAKTERLQGRRQVEESGVDTLGECEPITGVWGGAPNGSRSSAPGQGVTRGEAPWSWKLSRFCMPNGSSKFASFPYFANFLNPTYLWYIFEKKRRYRPRRHGQYCLSTEKQFGIVLFVMWEVALRSKSAQIVAPNVYWEAPLNHWT